MLVPALPRSGDDRVAGTDGVLVEVGLEDSDLFKHEGGLLGVCLRGLLRLFVLDDLDLQHLFVGLLLRTAVLDPGAEDERGLVVVVFERADERCEGCVDIVREFLAVAAGDVVAGEHVRDGASRAVGADDRVRCMDFEPQLDAALFVVPSVRFTPKRAGVFATTDLVVRFPGKRCEVYHNWQLLYRTCYQHMSIACEQDVNPRSSWPYDEGRGDEILV